MFPIDSAALDYDARMVAQFDRIIAEMGCPWKLRQLLPPVLSAGEVVGRLTEAGARLLDPSGMLQAGIPFVPPEGDAGTGMAAINAVRPGIGNVSAGTSAFAMTVADRPLGVHREIDMVTTPTGRPVAMVHCNNCTSDINAWAGLLADFLHTAGFTLSDDALYRLLFAAALDEDADCGGMMAYNYFSGEGIVNTDEGTPVFLRRPDCRLTLDSIIQIHLFSAMATLKIGLDILMQKECLPLDRLYAHGGFFRVPEVGQRILSAAAGVPVTVMETTGSGGPYGMALLAAYGLQRTPGETLEDYLDGRVFANTAAVTRLAGEKDIQRFDCFVSAYRNAFDNEMAAIQQMKRGAF